MSIKINIKELLKFFNNEKDSINKTIDEKLIESINKLNVSVNYIQDLLETIKDFGYLKVYSVGGEHIDMNDNISEKCCIDIYFYNEYMYMLTIYENGIKLLKNENKTNLDKNGHSTEDIDFKTLFFKYADFKYLLKD